MGACTHAAALVSYVQWITSYQYNAHHDSEDAIRSGDERIARSPVFGGEDLGRDGVQHAVHDVVRERVAAIPAKEGVGRACGRAGEQEHAGQRCRDQAHR